MLNLGTHITPEELQKLYEFDQKVDDFYLDIEFLREGDDSLSLLVAEHHEQFIAFAMDATGSIMAYWLYKEFLEIDQAPIVFLDSEGGGTVVASSSREFLSLLPYDTSFFSTVATHWTSYQEDPVHTIPPGRKYTQKFYGALFQYLTDSYPCYQDFRTWLATEMQIQPTENPFEVMVKNIEAYPVLHFL